MSFRSERSLERKLLAAFEAVYDATRLFRFLSDNGLDKLLLSAIEAEELISLFNPVTLGLSEVLLDATEKEYLLHEIDDDLLPLNKELMALKRWITSFMSVAKISDIARTKNIELLAVSVEVMLERLSKLSPYNVYLYLCKKGIENLRSSVQRAGEPKIS